MLECYAKYILATCFQVGGGGEGRLMKLFETLHIVTHIIYFKAYFLTDKWAE